MANRYDQYMGNQDSQQNSGSISSILTVGAIGVGLGAAVLKFPNETRGLARGISGLGGRAGSITMRGIGRLAQAAKLGEGAKFAGAFIGALDEALENRVFFHLSNTDRFEANFTKSFSTRMQAFQRRDQTILGGVPTQIETRMQQLGNFLSNSARSMSAKSLGFDQVMEALKRSAPEFYNEDLHSILTQQRDDFFKDPSKGKVAGILDRYHTKEAAKINSAYSIDINPNDHVKREQFINKVFDALDTYKNTKLIDKKVLSNGGDLNGTNVWGYKNFRKEAVGAFKRDNQVKNSFLNKVMENAGYRNLTVQDALDRKLFDADSIKIPGKYGDHQDGRFGSKITWMNKMMSGIGDLSVDPHLFIDSKGHIADMRHTFNAVKKSLDFVRDNFQVPFLKFNPLDLAHWTTLQAIREAPPTYFLRRGTIQTFMHGSAEELKHPRLHNQDAAVGPLAHDYVYMGGKVYNLTTGDIAKQDVYLASARFGMMPRIAAGMGNLHRQDYRDMGFFRRLFDFRKQETETSFSRMMSTYTKIGNEDWERNTMSLLTGAHGNDPEFQEKAYKNIYSLIHQRTRGLSKDTAIFLNDHVKNAYGSVGIDLAKLDTPEEVMTALGKLNASVSLNTGAVSSELNDQIFKMWDSYRRNPTEFLKNKRIISDAKPYLPGPLEPFDLHQTDLVDRVDDIKRLIHQHAIRQVEDKTGVMVGSLIKQGIGTNQLAESSLDEVRDLNVLTQMHGWWNDVYLNGPGAKDGALQKFTDTVRDTNNPFTQNLSLSVKKKTPLWAMGPGDAPPQYMGFVGNMVVNKNRGYKWALQNYNEMVKSGQDPLKALTSSISNVFGQPFAGRKNLGDVTTLSMVSYYMTERLDNAVARLGLGLSQKNRGSMQSILFNQFGRRIVLPYLAYQQFASLDDDTGNVVSDHVASVYANATMNVAGIKDLLGLNNILKGVNSLFPGLDQLGETPIGKALKIGTFGLIGDTRSHEDLEKYYENGTDPIRKSRWWSIGSNTPWEGGQIDHYEANWYRKHTSHYKYTDTMYGSSDEYWDNNWAPTLLHPLAPIRHFLTDTKHWERKHWNDRPYPTTGGIDELQMIPVVGPLIDNTVGRVLKPRVMRGDLKKQHRQYLEDVNNYIKSVEESTTGGGVIQLQAGGGHRLMQSVGFGGDFADGIGGYGVAGTDGDGYGMGGGEGGSTDMSVGQSKGYTTSDYANQQIAAINLGIASQQQTPTLSSVARLRDPNFVTDLWDLDTSSSLAGTLNTLNYNLTELGGIYGFGTTLITGVDAAKITSRVKLADSSKMFGKSRAFWDMNLGGLGGDLSEIGRRYNPKYRGNNDYNPIRNTMPNWMPGVDYFLDFQHGDPYAKIQKGETRLPGKAYEALNQLHPDAFGQYGAFDRYKILADVAPYSQEYKMWHKVVSQMNQAGLLDDQTKEEYADIRKQVTSKKRKYHFYPNKLRNAELKYENVTITDVLDANTFLTKEHPLTPFKLAGVKIKSDDNEAKELISEFVYKGAHVKIGVSADALFRKNDDMMNTIDAVVFGDGTDDRGKPWYASTKGENVNAMLARHRFGSMMNMLGGHNNIKVTDNGDPVNTAALYDKSQITVGRIWEFISHDFLPNIPVVGTVVDKFMQVRSPLEMYKKNEVYGKSWRPWTSPWSGWIQPMLQQMQSHNPVVAAAQGYGIGMLFGRATKGRFLGKWGGAVVAGGLATMRVFSETMGRMLPDGSNVSYKWIPERRKKEREINEYFDVLKYVKFRGLYEKAKKEALEYEGIDLDKILDDNSTRGKKNKGTRKYLEGQKKWLNIAKKLGYVDADVARQTLSQINDKLGQITDSKGAVQIGPRAMQAMQYREEYESTLYGADPNGDMTKIFRALPAKDREFFTEFMTATPSERQEILSLVPRNERRFYQAKWHMKMDSKQNLESYFTTHNLPGASWEGWDPNVNLDDIKVKVVKNEGLDFSEFNLWDDDVKRSNQSGAEAIPMVRPSMLIDPSRIQKVLHGAGLSDVTVDVNTSPSDKNKIDIAFNYMKDRSNEIIGELNNHLQGLFG